MKKIQKGSRWLCIKTVVMDDTNEVTYNEGKTYESEVAGCLTDNNGDIYHRWDCDYFAEHFEEVKTNKERYMKTIETVLLRTLFFLPVAIIHFIWAMRTYLIVMFLYCKYGGEHIVYPKDRKYIADVYDLLEKSLKEK